MQSDSVTRILLGFIAICMLLLLAQGAGMSGGSSANAASSASDQGRYKVMVQSMKGGGLLVKTDTATGTVWRKSLTGDGPWVLVDEESR